MTIPNQHKPFGQTVATYQYDFPRDSSIKFKSDHVHSIIGKITDVLLCIRGVYRSCSFYEMCSFEKTTSSVPTQMRRKARQR